MFWEDKALHLLISFAMTAIVVIPIVRRLQLNKCLCWSGLFPGLLKEYYDLVLTTMAGLNDSMVDVGADLVGVLKGILIWSRVARGKAKGSDEVPVTDRNCNGS